VVVAASPPRKRNRWHLDGIEDAIAFLCKKARNAFKASRRPHILIIGAPGPISETIAENLSRHGMTPVLITLQALEKNGAPAPERYACILCADMDIRQTTAAAQAVLTDSRLSDLPFEYVTFPKTSYTLLARHDTESALDKVSPLPTYSVDVFALYETSLEHFEKKCDIRDYMDICQLLKTVHTNRIDGDVAEFGSYRGHSGYLIASLMAAMDMDKHLWMFDTFDSFPEEPLGIDQFWSGSHPVNFREVQAKFADFPFVTLVEGDFTRTFDATKVDKLAFVYVDCDAYRSTAYLIGRIFPDVLAPGGIMVFEDYGHAQLLGNRAAVHHYFDARSGCVQFFSQFSGCYIVIKLPD
jgi:hypothetical protein